MSPSSHLFADFVESHGLRDVAITCANFTWLNMQSSPKLSKLDKFFLLAEWDLIFLFSKGLARLIPMSDHIPLVLCGKMASSAP